MMSQDLPLSPWERKCKTAAESAISAAEALIMLRHTIKVSLRD
jgi:hypothetical protein